jgi:hypothetical protein
MITKKNIVYLIAAIVIVILCVYLLSPGSLPEEAQETTAAEQPGNSVNAVSPAPEAAVPPGAVELPEPTAVEFTEEKPILGQFMRVREIRENDDGSDDGAIRNLEIVFREGILPNKLFPDNRQVILRYDQLARNMVGYGAATIFFFYEIVTHDTNGDGMLSDLDAITVAVSRPTGREYRVLVSNVDEVLGYEDLPEEEDTLSLRMRIGGEEVTNVYSLTGM